MHMGELKLDLTPEVLRNAARSQREHAKEKDNAENITIPFPEELQKKEPSNEQ